MGISFNFTSTVTAKAAKKDQQSGVTARWLNISTNKDYEKIENIGRHPYPVEYVEKALSHLIESDDVDESAESSLMGVLKEIQKHIMDGNTDKAKEMMGTFKQYVNQELKKGSLTQRASTVLLVSANRFIEAHQYVSHEVHAY